MARESVIDMQSARPARGETARRDWTAPAVEDLAPLSALTLFSTPIEGNERGFSWLDIADPSRRLG